jgi:hypothetical protein
MPPRRKPAKPQPKPGSAEAKEQELFEALADLLRRLGHDVHVSKTLDGRGGDCLVNGEPRVIVSRRLPMAERVDVLIEVARRQDLAGVELTPQLAEALHRGPSE